MLRVKNKRGLRLLLAVCLFVFIGACIPIEDELAKDLQENYGMGEREAETGAAYGIMSAHVEKNDDGSPKIQQNQDGTYLIDYAAITGKEKIDYLAQKESDFDFYLNNEEWNQHSKFLKKYGVNLKESFKKKKVLCQWWKQRFEEKNQHLEFKRLMSGYYPLHFDKKWRVSACAIFPSEKEISFEPDYVRNSNEQKILENIEASATIPREVDNPDYPHIDAVKKKIWKTENYRIRVLSFDITQDHKADYIKVYRLTTGGQQEKYPIISVFHADNEQDLTIAAVDLDKPGDSGFGIPDFFEKVDISSTEYAGWLLYHNYSNLIDKALKGKEEKKVNFPEKHCQTVYLVRPGDVPPAVEINSEGWAVPFEYKAKKRGVVINFKPLVKFKTKNGEELGAPPYDIEYIAFAYHGEYEWQESAGRVVEYYKPAPDIVNKKVRKVKIGSEKLMKLIYANGSVAERLPEFTIGKLFRIDYDLDSKRVRIEDKDGDGKLESKTASRKPEDLNLIDHSE